MNSICKRHQTVIWWKRKSYSLRIECLPHGNWHKWSNISPLSILVEDAITKESDIQITYKGKKKPHIKDVNFIHKYMIYLKCTNIWSNALVYCDHILNKHLSIFIHSFGIFYWSFFATWISAHLDKQYSHISTIKYFILSELYVQTLNV